VILSFALILNYNGLVKPYLSLTDDGSPSFHMQATTRCSNKHQLPQQNGFAACLNVLEDSIRLTEWIAYHCAILPLDCLVIALDNKNTPMAVEKIKELQRRWQGLDKEHNLPPITIKVCENYTYIGEQNVREWLLDNTGNLRSPVKNGHPFIEAQDGFVNQCLAYHKMDGRSWVLLTDSDEFLLYNYVHKDENSLLYDDILSWKGANKIDQERKVIKPIREHHLPTLNSTTIISFLNSVRNSNIVALPDCVRFPAIYFAAHEPSEPYNDIPEGINATLLSTLQHRRYGREYKGDLSKVMIDVSRVPMELLKRENTHTIHNPNKKVCGWNGNHASGMDHMSSIF
jgi:hypothetical protein